MTLIIEPLQGPHTLLEPSPISPPRKGVVVDNAANNVPHGQLKRITDLALDNLSLYNYFKSKLVLNNYNGFHPGYHRMGCESSDGKQVLAFQTNGGSTVLSLETLQKVRYPGYAVRRKYIDAGEKQQLRWNRATSKHEVIGILNTNIISPGGIFSEDTDYSTERDLLVAPSDKPSVWSDDHAGDYYRWIPCNVGTNYGIFDLLTESFKPLNYPGLPDVFANWVRTVRVENGHETHTFYNALIDLVQPCCTITLNTTSGHNCWATLSNGQPVWVFQDNSMDGIRYFEPATATFGWIIGLPDLPGGVNHHPTTLWSTASRGWILLSTYWPRPVSEKEWAANQLLLVEIAEPHRIVRLGHNQTLSFPTPTSPKTYYGEAFVSASCDCQRLYWGCNWNGKQGQLELYRLDLGPTFWDDLRTATVPIPQGMLGQLEEQVFELQQDVQVLQQLTHDLDQRIARLEDPSE